MQALLARSPKPRRALRLRDRYSIIRKLLRVGEVKLGRRISQRLTKRFVWLNRTQDTMLVLCFLVVITVVLIALGAILS